jgi:hypothetical protein
VGASQVEGTETPAKGCGSVPLFRFLTTGLGILLHGKRYFQTDKLKTVKNNT